MPSEGTEGRRSRDAGRARFRRAEHVRRRPEFEAVYGQGVRIRGKYATVFSLANTLPIGRLGIAATRKLGGAVERNRAKRLIRDVFRRNKIAPGFDVVVVPLRELLKASLDTIEQDYRASIEKSLRRHQRLS